MESIWTLAQVGQVEFAATSTLLAVKAKKQSLLLTEQSDDESDDDCEPEDDEEDHATSKPTPRLAKPRHDALINKFLDRLAEVFSREKSHPQSSNRQDSEHVAATAWIEPDDEHPLTVIVAKNRGNLDDQDVKILASLKRWLRLVTLTGHCPSTQTDRIWVGDGGLVEYSRSRLWYHISQIHETDKTLPTVPFGVVAVRVEDMQRLCRGVQRDLPVEQLSNIVNAAYDNRCAWRDLPVQSEHKKAVRAINMLGRLRAAYEYFKSVALTFDEAQTMEMEPINLCHNVQMDVNRFQGLLQKPDVDLRLPKNLHKSRAASDYRNASRLRVHAEMQVLVSLGQNPGWHKRAHPYIGVSKKLCFLCHQILQNYSPLAQEGARRPIFNARPCHGKVYPLWTLPQCVDLLCTAKLSLATAVTYAHRLIRHKLREKLESVPAMAESTAGVTSAGSLPADLALLKDRHIADGRPLAPPQVSNKSEQPSPFGRKKRTVKVLRLPADGSKPTLVPIAFHAISKTGGHRTIECKPQYVPDFHVYWREHQFERRLWNLTIENQADEGWNGKYRLHWNDNYSILEKDALPENNTVKKLLREKDINPMRRFWHGDVFFMKYSEPAETSSFDVHDLPFTIPQCQPVLEEVFRDMWEKKSLEELLEEDRFIAGRQEKLEADKEILLERMLVPVASFAPRCCKKANFLLHRTPIEQAILKLMPPGTLDYLALTDCDDGATGDVSVENLPNDPTMVRVSSMVRRTALETMGWTGFDSSQL